LIILDQQLKSFCNPLIGRQDAGHHLLLRGANL